MKILQICPRMPYPTTDGGSLAMYQVYDELTQRGHKVVSFCLNTSKHFYPPQKAKDLGNFILSGINTDINKIKAFFSLFSSQPYILERFFSESVEHALKELLKKEQFDIVQFEGTYVMPYLDVVRTNSSAKCILRVHNLEYRIWEGLAANANGLRRWYFKNTSKKLRRFEQQMIPRFDGVASISPVETIEIQKITSCPVRTIEYGIDRKELMVNRARENTLFILASMNWKPNIDGVNWFLDNIWVEVANQLPELELHVAGYGMSNEMKNLKIQGVTFHGTVEDAGLFRSTYDVMLVPLRSGGGMRIKILEGLSVGKAIVSTAKGAEGIKVKHNEHLLIANTREDWINSILKLYSNAGLKSDLEKSALEIIDREYNRSKIVAEFEKLYEEVSDGIRDR